jgi:hypothetical protein
VVTRGEGGRRGDGSDAAAPLIRLPQLLPRVFKCGGAKDICMHFTHEAARHGVHLIVAVVWC